MSDAAFPFALLLTIGIGVVSAAGLRAWRQWLDVKRMEITDRSSLRVHPELGELRRRVRRLEALASGIDI